VSTSDNVELSPEAIAFENLLQSSGEPSELDVRRNATEALHRAASEPEGVTYREVDANGVFAIWAEPLDANTDFVILHSHAGGSVVTSAFVDRKLAGHIAKAVGIPILVVDFRRAPEDKYPAQLDDVDTAFEWLLAQGYPPEKIITIGHSIGGFLALAVALRRRDAGKSLPGAIVSISPWADLGISNATIESNAGTDKVLSRQVLEFFREMWIGGTETKADDPKINLNAADLSGLPPTLVSWGTYEVLAGEDEVLAGRLEAAGVQVESLPVPGAQHSYIWAAGRVPETDRAIQQIASWVRSTLAL
jgi:acetyl esterase/lipase